MGGLTAVWAGASPEDPAKPGPVPWTFSTGSGASTQILARISDFTGDGAGGDGRRGGQKDLRFLMTHPPREVPVGGADAFERRVHAPKGVHRPAQASCAARVLRHLHACIHQDFPNGFLAPS